MLASRKFRRIVAGIAVGAVAPFSIAFADTYIGETVGSRVYVYFRVPAPALQRWLPEGWTSAGFGKGPLDGSNVMLRFHESDISLGADGKPDATSPRLSLTLITWARSAATGKGWRIYVPIQYATTDAPDSLTHRQTAGLSRRRTTSANGQPGLAGSESWTVEQDGARLVFRMEYADVETSYNAFRPSLYSTDVTQGHKMTDIVQITGYAFSETSGTDRMNGFRFESDLPELAPLFDGTHELRAVRIVSHVRTRTYLP